MKVLFGKRLHDFIYVVAHHFFIVRCAVGNERAPDDHTRFSGNGVKLFRVSAKLRENGGDFIFFDLFNGKSLIRGAGFMMRSKPFYRKRFKSILFAEITKGGVGCG